MQRSTAIIFFTLAAATVTGICMGLSSLLSSLQG